MKLKATLHTINYHMEVNKQPMVFILRMLFCVLWHLYDCTYDEAETKWLCLAYGVLTNVVRILLKTTNLTLFASHWGIAVSIAKSTAIAMYSTGTKWNIK